jgi:hypothetical protein
MRRVSWSSCVATRPRRAVSCARRSAAWALRWIARRFCRVSRRAGLEVVAALLDVRALAGERRRAGDAGRARCAARGHVGGGAAISEVLLDRRGGLLVAELDAVGEGAAGGHDHLDARERAATSTGTSALPPDCSVPAGARRPGRLEGVAQHHPGRALDAVAHAVGGALHVEALDGELAAQHREQPARPPPRRGGVLRPRGRAPARRGSWWWPRRAAARACPWPRKAPATRRWRWGRAPAGRRCGSRSARRGRGARRVGHPGVGREEVHPRPGDVPRASITMVALRSGMVTRCGRS